MNAKRMKYSLRLGNVAGIQVSVHWTFLFLILWIVYLNRRQGLSTTEILWSVGFILTIFLCVILHELGHALAARRYGISTRDITILPIGGVARLERMPEKPKEELVVAIAGPLVNVAIALLLVPVVALSTTVENLSSLQVIGPANFLAALVSVNIWLVLFNLIPAFPMDGGRIFRALLGFRFSHAKATRIAATLGQILAVGFVIVGFMYNPFLIFIGFFIFLGAQSEALYAQSKFILKGCKVSDVTMHEIPVLESHLSVSEAVSLLLNGQARNFLVVREGRPVGTLNRDQIIQALSEPGKDHTIAEVMDAEMIVLAPEMPLEHAWQQMQAHKKSLMPVMADGQLLGVVDRENMAEFTLVRTAELKRSEAKL